MYSPVTTAKPAPSTSSAQSTACLPQSVASTHTVSGGRGSASGEVVIAYGIPEDILGEMFESIKEVATVGHPLAIPQENDVSVYLPVVRPW